MIAAAAAMHFWNEQARRLEIVSAVGGAVRGRRRHADLSGSWFAAGVARSLAVLYRRIQVTFAVLAFVGLFVALVPPFSYSIT